MDLLVANNEFSTQSLTIWKRKLENKITKFEKQRNLHVETVLKEAFKKASYQLEEKVQKRKINSKMPRKPLIRFFLYIGLLRNRSTELTSLDGVKMSAANQ